MTNVAVVYYSSTGSVHALADALADGAAGAGATVRLRRVRETAPDEAVDANPAWRAHLAATRAITEASHDDLRWADAIALGTPTRFGSVSAQLKGFLDTTGPLWAENALADKPMTAFTSASSAHGGHESTLLALYNTMHHWGAIIVPPGYTDDTFREAGNPYGTSHTSDRATVGERVLATAARQGGRLASVAAAMRQPVAA